MDVPELWPFRRKALSLSVRRLRPLFQDLQHLQGARSHTHGREAVPLFRARLQPVLRQCNQLQKPQQDPHWYSSLWFKTTTHTLFSSSPSKKLQYHFSFWSSGERPYVCTIPGCDKRFTEYSSLYKHQVVHTPCKPYECSHCGKTYKQISTMALHKRTAHNDSEPIEEEHEDYEPPTGQQNIFVSFHNWGAWTPQIATLNHVLVRTVSRSYQGVQTKQVWDDLPEISKQPLLNAVSVWFLIKLFGKITFIIIYALHSEAIDDPCMNGPFVESEATCSDMTSDLSAQDQVTLVTQDNTHQVRICISLPYLRFLCRSKVALYFSKDMPCESCRYRWLAIRSPWKRMMATCSPSQPVSLYCHQLKSPWLPTAQRDRWVLSLVIFDALYVQGPNKGASRNFVHLVSHRFCTSINNNHLIMKWKLAFCVLSCRVDLILISCRILCVCVCCICRWLLCHRVLYGPNWKRCFHTQLPSWPHLMENKLLLR